MGNKIPADFSSHEEWLSYIRQEVPASEQAYALAFGRMQLFRRFYEVRKQTFPTDFADELLGIQTLSDPERTNELESLNKRIFSALTDFLSSEAQPRAVEVEVVAATSASEHVQQLLDHLSQKNPYFALWSAYKQGIEGEFVAEDWNEHLCRELGTGFGEEVTFTRAMVELDTLLLYYRDRNLALPKYFFERIWFIHHCREPERIVQIRALLNTLAAEIEPCTSA